MLKQLLAVVVRGGAGAPHASSGFGVGGVQAVVADVHEGVEVAEERRVALETALDGIDGVLEVDIVFHIVGGGAVLDVLERLFPVVSFGVFALVCLELPFDLVGDVCHEGHAQGAVEFLGGLEEHLEGLSHDGGAAVSDTVAVVAKIGVHVVGLLGGDSYDFVAVLLPHLPDGACAGFLGRGGLDERNEVVDLGGGGRGVVVTHGRTPLGV